MSYCKIRIIINFLLQSCQILNNNRIDITCNRHDIPLIPYYFYNVPAMIPVVPIQQRNFLWNRMLVNSFLVRNPFRRSVYMGRNSHSYRKWGINIQYGYYHFRHILVSIFIAIFIYICHVLCIWLLCWLLCSLAAFNGLNSWVSARCYWCILSDVKCWLDDLKEYTSNSVHSTVESAEFEHCVFFI